MYDNLETFINKEITTQINVIKEFSLNKIRNKYEFAIPKSNVGYLNTLTNIEHSKEAYDNFIEKMKSMGYENPDIIFHSSATRHSKDYIYFTFINKK